LTSRDGFQNSLQGDRKYSASFLAEWLEALVTSGVRNGGENLQAYAAGGNYVVKVKPGQAWIKGYYYRNVDADIELAVQQAYGAIRYDRVILRLDLTINVRDIHPYVKQGTTEGPPALDRDLDAGVWELSLAQLEVTPGSQFLMPYQVIDERLDTDVCGIAHSRVEADTTGLFNTFFDYYMARKAEFDANLAGMQTDWDAWFGVTDVLGVRGDWDTWFDQAKANYPMIVFDAWGGSWRLPGMTYETTMTGNVATEQIVDSTTGAVYSTKTATFNGDGSITERISGPAAILANDLQKVTTFDDNVIREAISEVPS
jgi:hypothetical protein